MEPDIPRLVPCSIILLSDFLWLSPRSHSITYTENRPCFHHLYPCRMTTGSSWGTEKWENWCRGLGGGCKLQRTSPTLQFQPDTWDAESLQDNVFYQLAQHSHQITAHEAESGIMHRCRLNGKASQYSPIINLLGRCTKFHTAHVGIPPLFHDNRY